jgi:hypothetical protein
MSGLTLWLFGFWSGILFSKAVNGSKQGDDKKQ